MGIMLLFAAFFCAKAFSQQNEVLPYSEYLGYVKKYHPKVQQANLEVSKAEAGLMAARGAFDPKLEVDFDKKQFKDKEYYSILNSSFKIPTWYGIEVKAGFDNAEGIYVNPQNSTPNQGLTSLGINIPLGQGLFVNQRMADLRMAKVQLNLSAAERRLQALNTVYDASVAYFNWARAYKELMFYEKYLRTAKERHEGIKKLILFGDKPAIDSIESGIVVKNRQFSRDEARLKLVKSKMEIANYLWLEGVPIELQDTIIPEQDLIKSVPESLGGNRFSEDTDLNGHPKIQSLMSKLDQLKIERKLKQNLLLPKVDLGYYHLNEKAAIEGNGFQDYKIGLNFSFPLFLRKERGSLKLANLKIQDAELGVKLEKLELKNKITALKNEIDILKGQLALIESLANDHAKMLSSEERLFSFGESSLFLLNTRENNFISIGISQIEVANRYLQSYALLYKTMANDD